MPRRKPVMVDNKENEDVPAAAPASKRGAPLGGSRLAQPKSRASIARGAAAKAAVKVSLSASSTNASAAAPGARAGHGRNSSTGSSSSSTSSRGSRAASRSRAGSGESRSRAGSGETAKARKSRKVSGASSPCNVGDDDDATAAGAVSSVADVEPASPAETGGSTLDVVSTFEAHQEAEVEALEFLENMPKKPRTAKFLAGLKEVCKEQVALIKGLKKQLSALLDEKGSCLAALRGIEQQLDVERVAEAERASAMALDVGTHQARVATLEKTTSEVEARRDALDTQVSALTAREATLSEEAASLTARLDEVSKNVAAKEEQIEALEKERDEASAQAAESLQELEAQQAKFEEDAAAATTAATEAQTAAVRACHSEAAAAEAEATKTHLEAVGSLKEELNDRHTQAQELSTQLQVLRAETAGHDGEKGRWEESLGQAEKKHADVEVRCGALQEQVRALQEKLANNETALSEGLKSFTEAQQWHHTQSAKSEAGTTALEGKLAALQAGQASHQDVVAQLEKDVAAQVAQCAAEARGKADAEGRLSQAEAAMEEARTNLAGTEEEMKKLKEELSAANEALSALQVEMARQQAAWEAEKEHMATTMAMTLESKAALYQSEVAASTKENALLRANTDTLTTALAASNEQGECLTVELRSLRANMSDKPTEQLEKLAKAEVEAEALRRRVDASLAKGVQLEQANDQIEALKQKLRDSEKLRRGMHNKIQDLRGNVRVYARTRPFKASAESGAVCPITCSMDGESLKVATAPKVSMSNQSSSSAAGGGKKAKVSAAAHFKFDQVFGPTSTQAGVFEEFSELVQSVLDGYNVCLFSYGQTGSGKTFTMSGSTTDPEQRGLIPRSVERLVEQVGGMSEEGWEAKMTVSFMEIYNEKIADMLVDASATKAPAASGSGLAIRVPKNGAPYVEGLVEEAIDVAEDIYAIMARAERTRAVAATDMNEHSSRSHTICTIKVHLKNAQAKVSTCGSLNLCDLAGSERLAKSKAEGARLKETLHINQSLSSLNDVFVALSQKAAHIPYRNSKLTHVLQNCLGGEGKAAMLVALSPEPSSVAETIQSLRFAEKVKSTKLGKAKKNFVSE